MDSIDFINNQNTVCRVISSYIYTLKMKIQLKGNTWNVNIFTHIQETNVKFCGSKPIFIRNRLDSFC